MSGGSNEIKETAYEKALAEVAMNELNQYKEVVLPFRNAWIDDVTRDTGAMEKQMAGQVNADLAQRTGGGALPLGVDPSSGAATTMGRALAVGNVGGKAATDATQGVRDQRASGLQAGLNIMRGENVDAQSGMQKLASDSVEEAFTDARLKASTRAATGSAIATGLGTAAAVGANMYRGKTYYDPALQTYTKSNPRH